MEIKISYPERDIMECTLVVIVFSVNAGKVINTRREVVEAVSLMLFKSAYCSLRNEMGRNEMEMKICSLRNDTGGLNVNHVSLHILKQVYQSR